MNLPIRFPKDEDVIAEEVRRFRALSPEGQVREFDEMFDMYHFLRTSSGRPEVVDRLAADDERSEREAVLEFAHRHV